MQACNAKSANAVKFSKPEGKQTASVNIKEAVVLEALHKYFEAPQASEGEVAYKSVAGTIHVEEKVIIFDIEYGDLRNHEEAWPQEERLIFFR